MEALKMKFYDTSNPAIRILKTQDQKMTTLYAKFAAHDARYIGVKETLNSKIRIAAWKFVLQMNTALKRTLDIVGSAVFLLAFSPIYLITSLAILIEDGRPIFYSQTRVAKRGRHFKMWKFRSMYKNADSMKADLQSDNMTGGVIFKMKHDPRITRTGRIIRKLSIDELPQLWHVFTGDLSLVGPRPPIPVEVAEYTPWDMKRLEVTPGLTCTWQVSGRSDIDFATQVNLDIDYIKQKSFFMDLVLLLRTVPAVLSGKGAY
jgi:lipopolysaccharide/colanic/teichoic acid biosynthesis glycosyltransferase